MTTERRTITLDELRTEQDDDGNRYLVGHAAVFDRLSKPFRGVGGHLIRERIAPGAFARAIKDGHDVRCTFNHDRMVVLGRTKSGTLTIEEDRTGLRFRCNLPDTQLVRDMVLGPIDRGDVDECSFGFIVNTGGESWEEGDGYDVRVLTDLDLFDVGPCTFPQYAGTDVALRSHEAFRTPADDQVEERGLSRMGDVLMISARGARQLEDLDEDDPGDSPEALKTGGLAVVQVRGPTSKMGGWFGVSTVMLRDTLQQLEADDAVSGVLLVVDSPGGQAAGNDEVGQAVAALNRAKPVHVFGEDTVASAAVWYTTQAERITLNRMGEMGSIGTYAVVADLSEMAKREGIKVHVVSSGDMKGQGVPGTKISNAFLKELQAVVDRLTDAFVGAVAEGRGMEEAAVRKLATGAMFPADEAVSLGLADAVGTQADAMAGLQAAVSRRAGDADQRARDKQKLAEMDDLE